MQLPTVEYPCAFVILQFAITPCQTADTHTDTPNEWTGGPLTVLPPFPQLVLCVRVLCCLRLLCLPARGEFKLFAFIFESTFN